MKNFLQDPVTYVIAYFFMIIFTFGHSYNMQPDFEDREFAGAKYTVKFGPPSKTIIALFASAAWPLYWSVQLQEKKIMLDKKCKVC